jgi:hypothetical protein
MRTYIPILTIFCLLGCKPDTQEPVPLPPPAPEAQATAKTSAPTTTTISIEQIYAQKNTLNGQSVRVQGRVVKLNKAIMNRNWLHLQDGTGNATDGNHDLTVTSNDDAKVGDEIVVTGTVGLDRDFSAGYIYPVLLEKGSITDAPNENKPPAVHVNPRSSTPPAGATSASKTLPPGHPPVQRAQETPPPASSKTLSGKVLEVVHADTRKYTYLQLQDGNAMAWAAVPYAQFSVGQTVSVRGQMFQKSYTSPSLDRVFENIWFGTLLPSPTPTTEPKSDSTTP